MKQFGVVGLGVMGKNLSLNLIRNEVAISVFNRQSPPAEVDLAQTFAMENKNTEGYDEWSQFVNSLEKPRKILIMVNAGYAVDDVIQSLLPFLQSGDLLMDGGNSHFNDTQRRIQHLSNKEILFLGIGISGGEEGAQFGASIMPGGSMKAYEMAAPFLEKIAAKDSAGKPCCNYIGSDGAGHFVKMVHNGIEYAEMQILAEIYHLMKTLMDLSPINISDTFDLWISEGQGSYLLEITRDILQKKEGPDFLIDKILDAAAQKGTGGWSSQIAIDMGIPLSSITEAVYARTLSGMKKERIKTGKAYQLSVPPPSQIPSFRQLKNAYLASKIINHHIGFDMLSKASTHENWKLNLPDIARIWTNGCIIRSQFMEDLSKEMNNQIPILLQEDIKENLKLIWKDLAFVISAGIQYALPLPVMSACLNYFLGYNTIDSSANLIQAQRDYFGAHTYKRKDQSEELNFHTDWSKHPTK